MIYLYVILIVSNLMIHICKFDLQGLANKIKDLVPYAKHCNCVRHIYANWKKMHKGEEFKKLF